MCNSFVFVWSRNGANWTKAFVKGLLVPELNIMVEQLADPPIAFIFLHIVLTSKSSVNVM